MVLGFITGTGTANTIPKWTSATAQGNSLVTDNGTTLSYSGTHINSATDYQIGGSTVLSNSPGLYNLFAGVGAGASNTSGQNTFLGYQAGLSNTTGFNNAALGMRADMGSGALENATAIGANAVVTSSNTIQLGHTSVTLVNTSGAINTAASYQIGGSTVLSNSPGLYNLFAGVGAGASNTSGQNTFLGYQAGLSNTTGFNNAALGMRADMGSGALENATAIGASAVVSASNTIQLGNGSVTAVVSHGSFNTTSGTLQTNGTTRIDNSGNGTFASVNSASDYQIGGSTVLSNSPGLYNLFAGVGAGASNTSGQNTFLGYQAGLSNTTGFNNAALGMRADMGSGALENATAIGANTVVSQSNAVILGNSADVGIKTGTPQSDLEVAGNGTVTLTARSTNPSTPNAGTWKIYVYVNGATKELRIIGPSGTVNTVSTLTP